VENTCRLQKLYDTGASNEIPATNPEHNPEEWCKKTFTVLGLCAESKYYKERLIVTVTARFDHDNLNELFKQAKKTRDLLLSDQKISPISVENNLRTLCKDCIKSVYVYPLIEIGSYYDQTDLNIDDEAITTFFYEIPDVGKTEKFLGLFPWRYSEVMMRVSGPSIIATKMSGIMRAKLINLIYESALYKMRECERDSVTCGKNEPCKKIYGENFEYLRNYIAETFFGVESGSSQIEVNSRLYVLSYISAFGAIVSVFAVMYAMPLYNSLSTIGIGNETLKTFGPLTAGFSIFLALVVFVLLAMILGMLYIITSKPKYRARTRAWLTRDKKN